ncbi:MAG: hypothetical protein JO169_14785 [Solirubrobacterales bacterium]|nr:hypothetical protein [Solirubrobacterales bacterium]
MSALRPHPHRGNVIAAGAVPLSVAGVLIELRMHQWSLGPRFVVIVLVAGLILAMGWLAPTEGAAPRTYQSILLIAGLLPLIVALELLAEVLGARRPPGSGGVAWTFGAEAAVAAAAARRARSGACTLIAALALAVAVEGFVAWVFRPQGPGTFRGMLLVLALAFGAGAVRLRDGHRRHAVALVNAAGLLTLLLALTYLVLAVLAPLLGSVSGGALVGPQAAPFGWKLWVLIVGFGLIGYAAVDREPGPAYVGVALLAAFALLAGGGATRRGSLVGWPLFLLVIGGAGIAIGMRPLRPLPPEPPMPGSSGVAGPAEPATVRLRDPEPPQ